MVDMTDYGVDKVLDGAAVASTGSATSAWFPCSNTKEFSVWAKSTSAGGTADVKVEMDQCPVTSTFAATDPYVTTVIDATDTGEAWSEYVNTTVNAIVAHKYRIKVTVVNANPADTVTTVYVSKRS